MTDPLLDTTDDGNGTGLDAGEGNVVADPKPADDQTPDWREGIEEDIRGDFKDFETVADLAKEFRSIKSRLPKVPEEYIYEAPEGAEIDDNALAEFKSVAKDLGLSDDQFKAVVNFDLKVRDAQIRAVEAENTKRYTEAITQLKKDWGSDYESNVKKARGAVTKIFPKEFAESLVELGLNNNVEFIKGMHRLSKVVSEDSLIDGEPRKSPGPPRDSYGGPMLNYPSMDK